MFLDYLVCVLIVLLSFVPLLTMFVVLMIVELAIRAVKETKD